MRCCVVVFVLAIFAFAASTPVEPEVQILLADAPALVPNPGPPQPDSDGMIIAEVVNVHKRVVILVHSDATEEGAARRQAIRDSWLQSLNRTSGWAFEPPVRRSIAVWFVVCNETTSSYDMLAVEAEGKVHGDMLFVNPASSSGRVSRFEELGSLLRWVRVAYFERFDYVLLTEDDSFIALHNLVKFCDEHKHMNFFYGGFVNSFEQASPSYGHKYYSPFVQQGTILLSPAVVELLSKEMNMIKPLPRFDATIGHYLMPFIQGKPLHNSNFIGDFKKTYTDVAEPIICNHVDGPTMKILSTPVFKDGKPVFPTIVAQVQEMSSRSVFVDPHPKDQEPDCDLIDGGGKCNFSGLKMLDAKP